MIKTVLSECHVTLTNVSELANISRVSLEQYIYLYESGEADKISNKGIVAFFDFLKEAHKLNKATVLACLLRLFGKIEPYENRLMNAYMNIMDEQQKKEALANISQAINGGIQPPKEEPITSEKAYKVWEYYYGSYDIVCDFAGRVMKKEAYGQERAIIDLDEDDAASLEQDEGEGRYYCGWNLHHMLPKGKGGPNDTNNLIPANIQTNQMASDKTSFIIDGRSFEVRRTRGKKSPYYGIYDKGSGELLIGFEPIKKN